MNSMKNNSINVSKSSRSCRWLSVFAMTLIFLFGTCDLSAQTKNVTITLNNGSLQELFEMIEAQSGYHFSYRDSDIANKAKVSVKVTNQQVRTLLANVLGPRNLTYSFENNKIIVTTSVTKTPSVKKVSGVVTDNNGTPIIGASVVEVGTTNGVSTDVNGKFDIEVNSNVLEIAYVGYNSQQVAIDNRTSLKIVLTESLEQIDEVVVTAYGTTRKSAITGAIAVVSSELLEKNKSTNISAGLQGLVPGVQVVAFSGQPGADQDIYIRGLGSFTADSKPLYVVDGVPFDLSLNSIPASDIESISVLKDAASASLYGAHASNGVILITTKKGKSGKPRIEFYATLGFSELAVPFPEKVDINTQWENVWQALYNDATDFMDMTDADARQYASDNVSAQFYSARPFTMPDGTNRNYRSGWNTDYPIGLDGKVKSDAYRFWDFDAYDYMFNYRLKQDYGVNISGAFNEANRYYASFSYLNDKGASIFDNFQRFTGRLSLDTKINKWLTMSNSVLYTESRNNNLSFDIRPIRVLSRENTYFLWDYDNNRYYTRQYSDELALENSELSGRNAYGAINPIASIYNDIDNVLQNLKTTTSFTAKLSDAFSFKTIYSYQLWNDVSANKSIPDNGPYVNKPDAGSVSRGMSNYHTSYFNNVLTYDQYFNNVHHVNAFIGQEAYIYKGKNFGASAGGLELPFFNEIGQATLPPSAWSGSAEYMLYSYFAKAQYDYDNKYFITATYRMDGSSRFAKENRWGGFFSVGGAWLISREKFMESVPWINNLKLRASYGQLGNDNIGTYYGYQALYTTGGTYYGALTMFPSQLANKELKWETNINMNLGLDITLFDKLSATFEVYKRQSKDLLMGAPLPSSTGQKETIRNIGSLENYGYEFEIRYNILKNKDFYWDIYANASHFRNKITDLPYGERESQTTINNSDTGNAYYQWKVGNSCYDMYVSDWAGINPENGRNQWWKYSFDDNGNIIGKELTENFSEVNSTEQRVTGYSALPKLYGSFGTDFRWKGLDLSLMFYYSLGGYIYDYNLGESSVVRESWATYENQERSWKKPGDITDIPKMYMGYMSQAYSGNNIGSSQWIYKNNFMRLKNLTVGYTFKFDFFKKAGIDKVRVYFRGDNLFTTGKAARNGTDPEAGGLMGQNKSGLTYFATRNYNFGINVTF